MPTQDFGDWQALTEKWRFQQSAGSGLSSALLGRCNNSNLTYNVRNPGNL
ncbi:hypothetical protein C8R31_102369 [Nitrosospira sp. Nsp2]|nr:hypothetical protein C8R31_102369 [Nitrosospira sp. Nsp2]